MGMRIRLEQIRQASRIHGGFFPMLAIAAGVKLARLPIPSERLRLKVFRSIYGGKYPALDEGALGKPLSEFRSLNELFARGSGRIAGAAELRPEELVSPCESCVQEVGRLHEGTLLTAKGIPYTLPSLLPGIDCGAYRDGHFAILFLSPRDCHRVYTPQAGRLTAVTHVPGYRLLVHPSYQRAEFPVFTLNERVILEYETETERCLVVMVAGWGVGHITHPFPLEMRKRRRAVTRQVLNVPREFESGEWLATFELGSTVIVIAEPRGERRELVRVGETVAIGQRLFSDGECGESETAAGGTPS
jgi:phosphatidylserine decarboxylase